MIERTLKQQTAILSSPIKAYKQRIQTVHNEIMTLPAKRLPFEDQENEIKQLKNQLIDMESQAFFPSSTNLPSSSSTQSLTYNLTTSEKNIKL